MPFFFFFSSSFFFFFFYFFSFSFFFLASIFTIQFGDDDVLWINLRAGSHVTRVEWIGYNNRMLANRVAKSTLALRCAKYLSTPCVARRGA
jgi:hypothetical protein